MTKRKKTRKINGESVNTTTATTSTPSSSSSLNNNVQSFNLQQLSDAGPVIEQTDYLLAIEKADRKKQKKERQKQKRLAKKEDAKRRESSKMTLSTGSWLEDNLQLNPERSSRNERSSITLCQRPLKTVEYFLREIPCVLNDTKNRFLSSVVQSICRQTHHEDNKIKFWWLAKLVKYLITGIMFGIGLGTAYFWICVEDPLSIQIKQWLSWYGYWMFLGILSSVGLGTGLHTFMLYLGPFVAKVTLAAQECSTVNFPQPPYPDQILCPTTIKNGEYETETVSTLVIMGKVYGECLAWGFGTALGELPPFFMARAAKLSRTRMKQKKEELRCHSETTLLNGIHEESENDIMSRGKFWVKHVLDKIGFWGILIFASIPNPMFDLAGITCGHFMIPFITFFGATLIGKTIIKSQLQMLFVILTFNDHSLRNVARCIDKIPIVGSYLPHMFITFMDHQRATFSNKNNNASGGTLQLVLENFVLLMVIYFVSSIINAMAQSYHERITIKCQKRRSNDKKKSKAATT